jgi:hypothetical protein
MVLKDENLVTIVFISNGGASTKETKINLVYSNMIQAGLWCRLAPKGTKPCWR